MLHHSYTLKLEQMIILNSLFEYRNEMTYLKWFLNTNLQYTIFFSATSQDKHKYNNRIQLTFLKV